MGVVGRRRLLSGAGCAAALAGAAAARAGAAPPPAPLRVALLLGGGACDAGAGDAAGRALAAAFGDRVALAVTGGIATPEACADALRGLAAGGTRLAFVDRPDLAAASEAASRRDPRLAIEQRGAGRLAPNLGAYDFRLYEGEAVCGMLAARLSGAGICGLVARGAAASDLLGIDAFAIAARKVAPGFEVRVARLPDAATAGEEEAAAASLLAGGADLLAARGGDGGGVLAIGRARGVPVLGGCGPGAAAAVRALPAPLLVLEAGRALAGSWRPERLWWGFREKAVGLAPFGAAVTPAMREAAARIEAGIAIGALDPFEGPVRDAAGRLRIADGARPDDATLRAIDWPAAGVSF